MFLEPIKRNDPRWYEYALKSLHSLCHSDSASTEEGITNFLALGQNLLGLELGIVSEIYKDSYRIHCVGQNQLGLKNNQFLDLGDTICRKIVETKETFLISDISMDKEFGSHPAYTDSEILVYAGTPIFVSGKMFGTLNFSSQRKRDVPLNDDDVMILELLAKSLSLLLEKNTHNIQRDFFLRKLGHEMRSPLNGILGFCEILMEEVQDDDQREIFSIIARSSHTLEERINDLRHFIRLSHNDSAPNEGISLKAVLKKIIFDFEVIYPGVNSWIKNDLPVEEVVIKGSPLVTAIIKYLIKDCLNRRRNEKNISLFLEEGSSTKKILIHDEGPGPSEEIYRLFSTGRYFFNYLQDENLFGLTLDLVMAKLLCDQIDVELKVMPAGKGVIFSLEGMF